MVVTVYLTFFTVVAKDFFMDDFRFDVIPSSLATFRMVEWLLFLVPKKQIWITPKIDLIRRKILMI